MFINWKGIISSIAISSLMFSAPMTSEAPVQNQSLLASATSISQLKPSETKVPTKFDDNFIAFELAEDGTIVLTNGKKMTFEEFKKYLASKGIVSIESLKPTSVKEGKFSSEVIEVKVLGDPQPDKKK